MPRITLDLPAVEIPDQYRTSRLDMTLTSQHRDTLAKITHGLQSQVARLANGRIIAHGGDAVRYILELCATADETPLAPSPPPPKPTSGKAQLQRK